MKRLLAILLLTLHTLSGHAAGVDTTSLDGLLKQHVTPLRNGQATQVDYQGFSKDRAMLQKYLATSAAITQKNFDTWPKPDQLAFLINTYNTATIELVLTGYPDIQSIKELGSLLQSPWKKSFIQLLGKTRSLDEIEHELIRGSGRYNDPRVHFAVNCASIGCPALRAGAYSGEALDSQLEQATQAFLSDRTRNRLEKNTLQVSSIFKWYQDDFEKNWRGNKSLAAFLAGYPAALGLDEASAKRLVDGDIEIDFLDYDWQLNARR